MATQTNAKEERLDEEEEEGVWLQIAVALGLTIAIATALDVLFHGVPLSFSVPVLNAPASISMIAYHAAVAVAGGYIGLKGVRELVRERRFSVEVLMALAALGAVYLDFLFEGATVLFLYSLSEYFEDYIEDRARKTVEALSHVMPDTANVLVDGTETRVEVTEIQPRATLLVRPGERIALDGTVVEGATLVDQALVTGESIPVPKRVGDTVFAGTVNLKGVIRTSVTQSADNTLVSRIVDLVIASRKRKASIETLVDRFARVYVPLILLLSIATAVFGPYIAGGTVNVWLYRALILLVISCPSAFVISVPATIFTAVTIAARNGAIIKGGIYVEKLAKIKVFLFDKTGTLTFGRPVVQDIKSVEEPASHVLTYAAALEQYSDHPIAKSVVKTAREQNLAFDRLEVNAVEEIAGRGIIGRVNDAEVIVGTLDLLQEYGCNCEKITPFYMEEAHTAICISIAKRGAASMCLRDGVRKDAWLAIERLKQDGMYTGMLTGDKREVAEDTATELGLDEVHAELDPEDKLRVLGQIREKWGTVAMIGDGINDAPVLAVSDVGIAMGGSGVDVALESADIVLVKDELIQVPHLRKLSTLTMRIAKQNIIASLMIKVVLGALGLMGLIPLWFTVAAGDDGVTLLVLLNTLRLTKLNPESSL